MLPVLLAAATFVSTMLGGFTALKNKDRLHRVLGYSAGVIMGVVAFDLLPEIFELVDHLDISATGPMIALVVGFLLFHVIEKSILIHHAQEGDYEHGHHHPQAGMPDTHHTHRSSPL